MVGTTEVKKICPRSVGTIKHKIHVAFSKDLMAIGLSHSKWDPLSVHSCEIVPILHDCGTFYRGA